MLDALEQFKSDIEKIEISPKEALIRQADEIITMRLSAASGLPADKVDRIIGQNLKTLRDAARRKLPKHLDLEGDLAAFEMSLLTGFKEAVTEMRELGSFRFQIQRERQRETWARFGYGQAELEGLSKRCRDGDVIEDVNFDRVVVSRDGEAREITRLDMIEETRPNVETVETWRKSGGFLGEAAVNELRKKAAKAMRPRTQGIIISRADGSETRY
jgi:hypothetical protein